MMKYEIDNYDLLTVKNIFPFFWSNEKKLFFPLRKVNGKINYFIEILINIELNEFHCLQINPYNYAL